MTVSVADDLARRVERLEDETAVRRVVTEMATLADARRWLDLVDIFTPTVFADWSRLSGEAAGPIAARDLVQAWQTGLGGLHSTQHLLGNVDVRIDGDRASATAYVHAAHRNDAAFAGSVWVVAGRYDYELGRSAGSGSRRWRITAATLHPLWGWGNQHVVSDATAQRTAPTMGRSS